MKGEQIGEVREELKTKAEPNAWKALLQAGGQGSGSSSTSVILGMEQSCPAEDVALS